MEQRRQIRRRDPGFGGKGGEREGLGVAGIEEAGNAAAQRRALAGGGALGGGISVAADQLDGDPVQKGAHPQRILGLPFPQLRFDLFQKRGQPEGAGGRDGV